MRTLPPPGSLQVDDHTASSSAFRRFAREQTRLQTQALCATLCVAVVVTWPLDILAIDDPEWQRLGARARWLLGPVLATCFLLVRWTELGRRAPGAVLLGGCLLAGTIVIGTLGGHDPPHHPVLYTLYVSVFAGLAYAGPLPWRGLGAAAAFTTVLAAIAVLQPEALHAEMLGNFLAIFLFALGLAVAAGHHVYLASQARFMQSRELVQMNAELESRVEARTADLRALGAHQVDTMEAERKRIARDIHDELGQALATMRCEVELLELTADETTSAALTRIDTLLDGTIATSRRILERLRPTVLDELGLVAALEWLCGSVRDRVPGLVYELRVQTPPGRWDADLATVLFRITQECLNNVAKHAEARTVVVELSVVSNDVSLTVTDDGKGLGEARQNSMGIIGIRERLHPYRGTLALATRPEGGTRVDIFLPDCAPALEEFT